MIADDYRGIREARECRNRRYCSACMRFVHTGGYCTGCGLCVEQCEHSDGPPPTPPIGQGGRVAPTEAARRNDADAATRRWYIRRAREQSERMKR